MKIENGLVFMLPSEYGINIHCSLSYRDIPLHFDVLQT